MTSATKEYLEAIQVQAKKEPTKPQREKVRFLDVRELQSFLQKNKIRPTPQEKIINRYRVKVKYSEY